MGDHELPEPAPTVIERKVAVASLVSLLASIAYAVLDAYQSTPEALAWLPVPVRFAAVAALPPLLVFLAGYRTPSNRV